MSVYSNGENPYLSLRFLRNLNYVLDRPGTMAQAGQGAGRAGGRERDAQGGAGTSAKKQRSSSAGGPGRSKAHASGLEMIDPAYLHRGEGGAAGGPQLLAVLAVTHAWLCKESIAQLQVSRRALFSVF
jgi:hypothetical protein